jgi:sugar O-acyltransferase (sialic acid O-acetyltransferase NeuD family)
VTVAAEPFYLVGVASDYAWDVVETLARLGREVICIDNVGGADLRLPGLDPTAELPVGPVEWALGLSSATHRSRAAVALASTSLGPPSSLVDPTAVIASTAVVDHGVYVNAGVVIASRTHLGCCANINRSASVGHDCVVGFGASLGPGVVLTGHVTVGPMTFVGAGAVVLPGITLGACAIVGAGAIVTKDVPDGHVVVGNPAATQRTVDVQESFTTCPHFSTL